MSDELDGIIDADGGGATEPTEDKTSQNDEQLKTVQAQKEHWREKAEKLAKEKADLEAKFPKEEPKSSSEVDIVETMNALEGYTKDEREIIVNYSKRTGIPISKAVSEDVVQLAIEAKKAKIAKELSIPVPSGGSQGASDFKKVTDMTREEHMAYEAERLAQRTGKNNT